MLAASNILRWDSVSSLGNSVGYPCDHTEQMICPGILEICFPQPGQLRSRRVVSRSRARSTGNYPSWKLGRMIQWESTNELNALRLLDADPEVLRFSEQPCKITYTQDGSQRSHYPDILVEYTKQKEFWEVKSEVETRDPDFIRRTEILGDLSRRGYGYRVAVAEDLKRQPRLSNAIQMVHYGRCPLGVADRERLRLLLDHEGFLSWDRACGGEYGKKGRSAVCRLVLEGKLCFDFASVWTGATRFEAREAL